MLTNFVLFFCGNAISVLALFAWRSSDRIKAENDLLKDFSVED